MVAFIVLIAGVSREAIRVENNLLIEVVNRV